MISHKEDLSSIGEGKLVTEEICPYPSGRESWSIVERIASQIIVEQYTSIMKRTRVKKDTQPEELGKKWFDIE